MQIKSEFSKQLPTMAKEMKVVMQDNILYTEV